MRIILFWLFFFSASKFVLDIFWDKTKFVQFPFLMSAACLIFIIPTAAINMVSDVLISDYDYNVYMTNALMCFWAGILGYFIIPYRNQAKKVKRRRFYNNKKLVTISMLFFIIGLIAAIVILTDSSIVSILGLPIVLFIARFLRASIIIVIINFLIKKTITKSILILSWIWYPIVLILIFGRRSSAAFLAIAFLFPIFFIKRKAPKPIYVILALILGFFVIVLFPIYRNYTIEGNFLALFNLNPNEIIIGFLFSERSNEFTEACLNIGAVARADVFNYGAGFINDFIFQYVPVGLVGQEFKDSLMLKNHFNLYSIRLSHGAYGEYLKYVFPTGYANMFFEFGWFAFAPFILIGRFCKIIYYKALYDSDLFMIMFYCLIASFIPQAIYAHVTKIPALFLPSFFILVTISFLSREGSGKLKNQI